MKREINGKLLSDMLISGAHNLINNRHKVDDMNVFPVPDGDTGTNMSMTMKACLSDLSHVSDEDNIYTVLKSVANNTLRGARGNSGVILSQLMRGVKRAFKGHEVCDVKLLSEAFKSASDCAYRAVMKPTEGTILTVARVMGECAVEYSGDCEDVEQFIAIVVDAGQKALASTPDLLPKLKEAGVVDSGGQGLMFIAEGMLYCLSQGKIIELSEKQQEVSQSGVSHTEGENIKFAYCTECIVEKTFKGKSAFEFKTAVEKLGDSIVIVDDDEIVKLHIHTNNPNIVLGEALKVGILSSVKIENMKLQHSSLINKKDESKPEEKKKYAFVAVAAGDGISGALKDIGVDTIIEGGQTMNPSTEDIVDAVKNINAEHIFIFPNNKNIIMAAQQAERLCGDNTCVIPTSSVNQSMACMICFDETLSPDENKAAFEEALAGVKSIQITHAVRDTSVDGTVIKEGDYLGILDGKIEASDSDIDSSVMSCLNAAIDDDSSVITVFYGNDIDEKTAADLKAKLENTYSDCDVFMHFGGQPVYDYLISVE
ncbi:MAG: DAK2 domain-containing protein [Clostridia bacterium]|nr:DAK2 domain-containing protein [Clostridia bacterium]